MLPTAAEFTFYCHELGHCLGFDHTFGIPTFGSNATVLSPLYGDPYDLMSSATFGYANPPPIFNLPAAEAPGFPNRSAGPMLARAQLHFYKPLALEPTGRVRHLYEGASSPPITLNHAGGHTPGLPELLVYHPFAEDSRADGRVYVEYRRGIDTTGAARWDQGLPSSGDARDRDGIIVHVVRPKPNTIDTAVWYAGRIVLSDDELTVDDVVVQTMNGTVVVSVGAQADGTATVSVTRTIVPHLGISVISNDVVTVTSTELRRVAAFPWAGDFTWEQRSTTRTSTYTPVPRGFGGESPIDGVTDVDVTWYLAGTELTSTIGSGDYGAPSVFVHHSIDPTTKVLTLVNLPADGTYSLTVRAVASTADGGSAEATTTYLVVGLTEGWGDDYQRVREFWDRVLHPIPKWHYDPPHLGPDDRHDWYELEQIERLRWAFLQIEMTSPELAERLMPVVLDQQRVLEAAARAAIAQQVAAE